MKRLFYGFYCLIVLIHLTAEPVIHRLPQLPLSEQSHSVSRNHPEGIEIINPAEFGRVDGVFLAWAGWDIQLIADIARVISEHYYVYLLVSDLSSEVQAFSYLQSQNVNMGNVVFIYDANVSSSSMWIRDYAPFFIKEDGAQAIDDFYYGISNGNDLISYTIADTFALPVYDCPLIHHGGNHVSDGNGMGFLSTNIYQHNQTYTTQEVKNEFSSFFGIDSLIVIPPMEGDGTGHIDMFCKLLNDTLFIVGEYDEETLCYPGDREHLNEVAAHLSNLTNLDGRQFVAERIPMPPYTYGGPAGTINYTYTNSLIINDLVLVPVYGFETDEQALQIYRNLMPQHRIIGINSAFVIQYWGAVHCVTNSYFSENPLIILHDKIQLVEYGENPLIKFRLNPKFMESYASVFFKPESAADFTEITATLNNGIWSATLPEITENFCYYLSGRTISGDYEFVTTLPTEAPTGFYQVQCSLISQQDELARPSIHLNSFPNPFNLSDKARDQALTISFTISQHSQVSLTVFNIKGQKIKSLVNDHFGKGSHSVTWNGMDESDRLVSAGVYLFKLNIDNRIEIVNRGMLIK